MNKYKKTRKLLKEISDITVDDDDFEISNFYEEDATKLEQIASFLRKEKDEDTERFEFTSLSSKCTGIGKTIFIKSPMGESRRYNKFNLKLFPRQDTNQLGDMCMIIFDEKGRIVNDNSNEKNQSINIKILENLQKWIYLNIKLLIQHWYLEIDSINFCENQKKILKEIK
jgi:hypothetical protein